MRGRKVCNIIHRILSYDVYEEKGNTMSDEQKASIVLDELLKNVIDKTDGQVTYSNTMSVSVGENEVVLEFYFMFPSVPGRTHAPTLLQRIVLPIKLGMQLANMLSDGISQMEQQMHSLSNTNTPNK